MNFFILSFRADLRSNAKLFTPGYADGEAKTNRDVTTVIDHRNYHYVFAGGAINDPVTSAFIRSHPDSAG